MNRYENIMDQVERLYDILRQTNFSVQFIHDRCYEYTLQLLHKEHADESIEVAVNLLIGAIRRADKKFFEKVTDSTKSE